MSSQTPWSGEWIRIIKRQRAALPPPTVTTPLSSTTPPDLFLRPFMRSRLNITALSASEPVTITEELPNACTTCTVGPGTSPAYTDLRMDWGDACSLGRNGEQYFFCWLTRILNITSLLIRLHETLRGCDPASGVYEFHWQVYSLFTCGQCKGIHFPRHGRFL